MGLGFHDRFLPRPTSIATPLQLIDAAVFWVFAGRSEAAEQQMFQPETEEVSTSTSGEARCWKVRRSRNRLDVVVNLIFDGRSDLVVAHVRIFQ